MEPQRHRDAEKNLNAITDRIIGACIEIHRQLGQACWSQHTKSACVTSLRSMG